MPPIQGLNSTLALWWLESDQELVFVGDAGTTEVNGKFELYGVEFTTYYKPTEWLTVDADFAFTSAHFAQTPNGTTNSYIPNSIGSVITTGATVVAPNGLFGSTANDIAYAYDYRYPSGTDAQYGIMKHPVEPRMVRGTITVNF